MSMPNLLLLLAAALLINGCATVDQKISLDYSQLDRAFGRHKGTITIAASPSKPAVKNDAGDFIIGVLNNANGVHQANILTGSSLEEWITSALLRELQVVGYAAAIKPQIPDDAEYGIRISDISVTLSVNKGISSDDSAQKLTFNVDLLKKGKTVKTFTVALKDSRTIPLSTNRHDLEKIMRSSLQDAMQQIIPEVIALTSAP